MRRILLLILILLTLICCQHFQQKELLIKGPKLEPFDSYKKTVFNESFFTETHFNYADTSRDLRDLAKHFYSSETIIIEDTKKDFLRNCQAIERNDSLLLKLSDDPFSDSQHELTILRHNNQFSSNYYQTFSISDSSYRPPIYNIIDQNIILNKTQYKRGDSLKGKIVLDVSVHNTWITVYTDTIKIYGLIKTVVE